MFQGKKKNILQDFGLFPQQNTKIETNDGIHFEKHKSQEAL